MIEELEKEQPIAMMIQRYLDNNNIKVSHPLLPLHIEEMLTRQNYHKIADDEVVIKKSVYEELRNRAEEVFNEMTKRMKAEVAIERKMGKHYVEQAKRETVKEVLQELFPKEDLTVEHDFDIGADGKEREYELRYFIIYEDEIKNIANKFSIDLEDHHEQKRND
jgi:hypothetical protein